MLLVPMLVRGIRALVRLIVGRQNKFYSVTSNNPSINGMLIAIAICVLMAMILFVVYAMFYVGEKFMNRLTDRIGRDGFKLNTTLLLKSIMACLSGCLQPTSTRSR